MAADQLSAPVPAVPEAPSVAIVGSGAAGAVTAYRLRELLGPDARLVVLERDDRVGGRARSVEFAGTRVEVGGTLIHSSNRRLGDLLAAVGLEAARPALDMDGPDETLAIWDGHTFVLWSRTSSPALAWALIRRYGLRNVLRLRSRTSLALNGFTGVYAQQDSGRLFRTPRELLQALGLGDRADVSIRDFFVAQGVRGKLVNELVEGILRNMYNQNGTINAMAGSVALIGGGFAGGTLYSVSGGNAGLFERAIEHAGADLRLGREVVAVGTAEGGRRHTVVARDGSTDEVDAVAIAAPLEHSAIDLSSVGLASTQDAGTADAAPRGAGPRRDRPYQTVHTTLVAGELSGAYFGTTDSRVPSHLLTMAADDLPFKSIGVTGWSPLYKCRIYKVFSAAALSDALLSEMFSTVHDVHRLLWQAYPVLDPDPVWPGFELGERVFYVNAFESAVSALETEAVAAWNVAGLVAQSLR